MEKSVEVTNEEAVYTLSVVSRLSGIPAHSIRQYIDKGLIIPFKLDSGRHLFSRGDLLHLNYISKMIHEKGLNFAGIKAVLAMIPCWAIKVCSKDDKKSCQAYYSDSFPCWEASQKGRVCKNENCRECIVYKSMENHDNLKALLRSTT